jgi:cell division protein FtsN
MIRWQVQTLRTGALLAMCTLAGCGTVSDFTEQDEKPDTTEVQTAQTLQLETRTDTVRAERNIRSGPRNAEAERDTIRFTVQIGAFKDPHNASRVQQDARARFHLPVVNDYHTRYSLYQIRIGFFTTKEEADDFRKNLQREYPGDYGDAWVVTLKR